MNTSCKFSIVILILALVFGLFGLNAAAASQVVQQGPGGKITLLKADRPVYIPRTTVVLSLEVENDGTGVQDYQLTMVLYGPSGDEVFRSGVERINLLAPGERKLLQFQWATSSKTEAGMYTLTAHLRDLVDFDVMFDSVVQSDGNTFQVQEKPLLFTPDELVDFGDYLPGATPEQKVSVSNRGNGVLEWSVVSVAEEWVELVSPIGEARDTATIILRIKPDAPISRGLSGDLVITSNAGDREIPMVGNVQGDFGGDLNGLRAMRGLYRQGETLALEYEITNSGTVFLQYGAAVTLVGPAGRIVYDGNAAGDNVHLSLKPDASQTVNFAWDLPLDAPVGFYKAYVSLTYWFDPEHIFYDALNDTFMKESSAKIITANFEVKDGPNILADPTDWEFGTVLVEQVLGSANFDIDNSGGATLEWEIVSWPDWIEIAKPTTMKNVGGSNILARVRPSLPPDNYSGAIRIESNGGDVSIPISINITLPVTATPVPTATVEPTATPPPTETPVPNTSTPVPPPDRPAPPPPTSTPRPPTSTPVPPTATPAPTARPVVAQATTEPTPDASSGGCSAPLGNVSLATGVLNGLLLVAPLGLIIGAKYGRRRRK